MTARVCAASFARLAIGHAWYGTVEWCVDDEGNGTWRGKRGRDVTAIVQDKVQVRACGEEVHINENRHPMVLNQLFLGQEWKALPEDKFKFQKAVVVKYQYSDDPWKHFTTRAVGGERAAVTIMPAAASPSSERWGG